MKAFIFRLALEAIISTSALHAQVPQLLNYQGTITINGADLATGAKKFYRVEITRP